jgi:hypothetical protein
VAVHGEEAYPSEELAWVRAGALASATSLDGLPATEGAPQTQTIGQ